MTDPQDPTTTPPAAPAAPEVPAAPAYQAPAYPAAPPAYASAAPTGTVPGKTLGIVAFVLSFFAQLIALILGIVALVQSKKAGAKNGWAVAAIIISSVLMVVGIIVLIAVVAFVLPQAQQLLEFCQSAGPGMHDYNGVTVTCE